MPSILSYFPSLLILFPTHPPFACPLFRSSFRPSSPSLNASHHSHPLPYCFPSTFSSFSCHPRPSHISLNFSSYLRVHSSPVIFYHLFPSFLPGHSPIYFEFPILSSPYSPYFPFPVLRLLSPIPSFPSLPSTLLSSFRLLNLLPLTLPFAYISQSFFPLIAVHSSSLPYPSSFRFIHNCLLSLSPDARHGLPVTAPALLCAV